MCKCHSHSFFINCETLLEGTIQKCWGKWSFPSIWEPASDSTKEVWAVYLDLRLAAMPTGEKFKKFHRVSQIHSLIQTDLPLWRAIRFTLQGFKLPYFSLLVVICWNEFKSKLTKYSSNVLKLCQIWSSINLTVFINTRIFTKHFSILEEILCTIKLNPFWQWPTNNLFL